MSTVVVRTTSQTVVLRSGIDVVAGSGLPDVGTNGQVLTVVLGEWLPADPSAGSGAVDSVNTKTGIVFLDAADVGAATPAEVATAVSDHSAVTVGVHGIADTSALETTTGAQAKADAAIVSATAAEFVRDTIGTALTAGTGITVTVNDGADTITLLVDTVTEAERIDDRVAALLVAGTNVTLVYDDVANTLTINATGGGGGVPDPHAASHQDGGSDELALDASQITSGTVDDARLPAGLARDAEVAAAYQPLDADLTDIAALTTPATTITGAAQKASNLSDLANAETARASIRTGPTFHGTDYGVVANGTADDSAAIQLMINAAAAASGNVGAICKLPRGRIRMSYPVVVPTPGLVIEGEGPVSTFLTPRSSRDGSEPTWTWNSAPPAPAWVSTTPYTVGQIVTDTDIYVNIKATIAPHETAPNATTTYWRKLKSNTPNAMIVFNHNANHCTLRNIGFQTLGNVAGAKADDGDGPHCIRSSGCEGLRLQNITTFYINGWFLITEPWAPANPHSDVSLAHVRHNRAWQGVLHTNAGVNVANTYGVIHDDVWIGNHQGGDCWVFEDVHDAMLINCASGSGSAPAAGSGLRIRGDSAAIFVTNCDIGGADGSASPTVLIENGSTSVLDGTTALSALGGYPRAISVFGGTLQLGENIIKCNFGDPTSGKSEGIVAFVGCDLFEADLHAVDIVNGDMIVFKNCGSHSHNRDNSTAYDIIMRTMSRTIQGRVSISGCTFSTGGGAGANPTTAPIFCESATNQVVAYDNVYDAAAVSASNPPRGVVAFNAGVSLAESAATAGRMLYLRQGTSAFAGAGIELDMGNDGGSHTSTFLLMKKAGATKAYINSDGAVKGYYFHIIGAGGSTVETRLIGGTTSGAPVTGTYLLNDVVFAADGHVWICTAGGEPGTWVDVGGGGGGSALSVSENGTPLDATVTTLDFLGADFDLTESPEDEVNIAISAAIARQSALDDHVNDTADAHDASAISILDTANDFTATDVEGALAELQSDAEADATALSDHVADTTAAHAAAAVSVNSATLVGTGTDVQAVLEELDDSVAAVDASVGTLSRILAGWTIPTNSLDRWKAGRSISSTHLNGAVNNSTTTIIVKDVGITPTTLHRRLHIETEEIFTTAGEGVAPLNGVTSVATTGIFTKTAHALASGQPVTAGRNIVNSFLVIGTVYFVSATNLTANTFSLAATAGGAVLTGTGNDVNLGIVPGTVLTVATRGSVNGSAAASHADKAPVYASKVRTVCHLGDSVVAGDEPMSQSSLEGGWTRRAAALLSARMGGMVAQSWPGWRGASSNGEWTSASNGGLVIADTNAYHDCGYAGATYVQGVATTGATAKWTRPAGVRVQAIDFLFVDYGTAGCQWSYALTDKNGNGGATWIACPFASVYSSGKGILRRMRIAVDDPKSFEFRSCDVAGVAKTMIVPNASLSTWTTYPYPGMTEGVHWANLGAGGVFLSSVLNARVVHDAVTDGAGGLTSATAAFVAADVNSYVFINGVQTTIATRTNGTTATTAASLAAGSGQRLAILQGSGTGDWMANFYGHQGSWFPDLVIIGTFNNDMGAVDEPDFYGDMLQWLITQIQPCADILLVAPYESSAGTAPVQASYRAVMHTIAAANGVAILDLYDAFSEYGFVGAAGLSAGDYLADTIHLNYRGNNWMGAHLARGLEMN